MSQRKFHLHDGKKGSALAVRITPRASRNEIVEVMADGTIKIHIAAPPVDGEANENRALRLWQAQPDEINWSLCWIWMPRRLTNAFSRISVDRCRQNNKQKELRQIRRSSFPYGVGLYSLW